MAAWGGFKGYKCTMEVFDGASTRVTSQLASGTSTDASDATVYIAEDVDLSAGAGSIRFTEGGGIAMCWLMYVATHNTPD